MNELLYTTYLVLIKGILPAGQDKMTANDFIRPTANGRKMLQLKLIAKPEYELNEANENVLTSGGDTGAQNENLFNDSANEVLFNKIAGELALGNFEIEPADKTVCKLTKFYYVGQFREMFTKDEFKSYNIIVVDGKQKLVDFEVKRNSVDDAGNIVKVKEVVKTKKIKFFMHKFELEKPNAEEIAMNKFEARCKTISAYKRWVHPANAEKPTADPKLAPTTEGEIIVPEE